MVFVSSWLARTALCLSVGVAGVLGKDDIDVNSFARANSLSVKINVAKGLLNSTLAGGRVVVLFAPNGTDPIEDTDVVSSPDHFYGKNVFSFGPRDSVTLSGGNNDNTAKGVYGYPIVGLQDLPAGFYTVQAFLNPYENVTRSDGSVVSVHFPCGDGSTPIDGFGSLLTSAVDVEVVGGAQTIQLTFNSIEPVAQFFGTEIGGCRQGNYADTTLLKYVKIRSKKLSAFWGRDMYVGANVLLPAGYSSGNSSQRYPVIYSQGHWPGGTGPFSYPRATFSASWNNGTVPANAGGPARPAPKLILVRFRHETPFYDDSYAVNTPNLGPYGDAINEELIPYIDKTFNTIAQPYARIQEGGSTGGWESIANLIFRPDLFGACFSSYPDSLSFYRHQSINLYENTNAYVNPDGSNTVSIRTFSSPTNDTPIVLATSAQENHWELTQGTSSRSFLQWDVWNAVYGVQGYNNYPLEPWDKVTGEIYTDAVEYWKHMDLAGYLIENWNNSKNLGTNLAGRVFVYVGTHDDYSLNMGVQSFQNRTDAISPGWANITYGIGQVHGGNYQRREIWNYLEFLDRFIKAHAPNGTTPLSAAATSPKTRGNEWNDVMRYGGRKAAVARQADPKITNRNDEVKMGVIVKATVGRWDPGMDLTAMWAVNGKSASKGFKVTQGMTVQYPTLQTGGAPYNLSLWVTGEKRNYDTETRMSNAVQVGL